MTPSLRQAAPRDLGFIFSLAQNGARHGHFDSRIITDKAGTRAYFETAIEKGADPWGSPAHAFVVLAEAERIGAVLVTRAAGTPDGGVELAMIALRKEFRGQGLGAAVLDDFLGHYLPRGSVYARCRPASDALRQMLLGRGFEEVGKSGDSVILRRGALTPGAVLHARSDAAMTR
jgi:GNAT superfamily N-acetyltransferase